MTYLILKALLSGVIIMAVSEIARRSPAFGALVASLPLVSFWHHLAVARHKGRRRSQTMPKATFWYVIPSLPMFLIPLDAPQRRRLLDGADLACLITILLYGLTVLVAARFGVRLWRRIIAWRWIEEAIGHEQRQNSPVFP